MKAEDKNKLFQNSRIRTAWDREQEEWLFSVVDVCKALTESVSQDTGAYWRKLKQRLIEEGSEVVTNCHELKMIASDGKKYMTDVADTETLLRIIQSIPSKKAEPFKQWLAQVGRERIDEINDPELTIERAMDTYLRKGYDREWILQRLQSIKIRRKLTDEWDKHGIKKGLEYAILTDEISKGWSGMATKELELKNTAEEDEAILYEYIKVHGGVSATIASKIVGGISKRTVQRRLNDMVEKGMIRMVGATNNLKYVDNIDKNV